MALHRHRHKRALSPTGVYDMIKRPIIRQSNAIHKIRYGYTRDKIIIYGISGLGISALRSNLNPAKKYDNRIQ